MGGNPPDHCHGVGLLKMSSTQPPLQGSSKVAKDTARPPMVPLSPHRHHCFRYHCLPGYGSVRNSTPGLLARIWQRYTRTARTGRSNQVASLWAAKPTSTNNHAKSGLGAKLKSSKTNDFGYQNQLLKPESDPAWLETPWVLFLAPTQVAQPLGRWYRSLFTRSGCTC